MTAAPSAALASEQTILSIRPHPATIGVRSMTAVVLLIVYATLLMEPVRVNRDATWAWGLLWAAVLVAVARVVIEVVRWLGRRYVLTEARITSTDGVFRRWRVEMPLDRIQYVVQHRSIVERLLGLGTIGVSSAGGGLEVLWIGIASPRSTMDTIAAARDAARAAALHHARAGTGAADLAARAAPPVAAGSATEGSRRSTQPAPSGASGGTAAGDRPFIIGLAGGIGSGKSAVARALESLGAVVSDSDAEARALLQTPEVKATLIGWWGESILTPEGAVDRRAVADIIFKDPAQRTRLESLIHPMLRAGRERLKADARSRGTRFVVIDAPLLFEAGVDRECDEVWFIDAPRERRLERVRTTRNWDDAELARREAAQMDLAEKRRRATRVIANDTDEATLITRLREALDNAAARPPA